MAEILFNLQHINKTFGGVKALSDVSFDLRRGEVHCLVGQNGCGKSTLIKIIAGVLLQDSGIPANIEGVAVIYQDLSLFPNMTAAENIYLPLFLEKGRRGRKELRRAAEETLSRLGARLDPDAQVAGLSVADRQLVAIARALTADSRILIMDEPTSSLTKREIASLFSIVSRLKEEGVSIIFVGHKLDEIIQIADRITVMRDGVVRKTIARDEADEEELAYLISGQKLQFLGRRKEAAEGAGQEDEAVPVRTEAARAGASESEARSADGSAVRAGEPPLLQVENLGREGQFHDVSFTLRKGEVLGLIGSLGAGRSEVAQSIFGLQPFDRGRVLLEGEPLQLKNNRQAIRRGIAYVPEDRVLQGVAIDQPTELNLTALVLDQCRGRLPLLSPKKTDSCTRDWISRLAIRSAEPELTVSSLSGGNQQKVVLAKWLSIQPKALILDQPTNGIDIGAKYAIYEIIQKLSEQGMGILLISDEPQEIFHNCGRAMIMEKGGIKSTVDLSGLTLEEFEERINYEE